MAIKASHNAKTIKRLLRKEFDSKFKIFEEYPCLIEESASYRPDLVFISKKNDSIQVIIEIEWKTTRKHMVGGIITADYCMRQKKFSPVMCVLLLDEKRENSYHKREAMLKQYIKSLRDIKIGSKDEIIDYISNLKGR